MRKLNKSDIDKYNELKSGMLELDVEQEIITSEIQIEKLKIIEDFKKISSEIKSGKKYHKIRGYNLWYIIKNFFKPKKY